LRNRGRTTAVVKEAHKAYDEMMVRYVDAIKSYDAADLNSALAVDRLVKGVDREPTRLMDEIVTSYRQHAEYLYQTEIKFDFYVLLGCVLGLAPGGGNSFIRYVPCSDDAPPISQIHVQYQCAGGESLDQPNGAGSVEHGRGQ